jgi:hypothetical protein
MASQESLPDAAAHELGILSAGDEAMPLNKSRSRDPTMNSQKTFAALVVAVLAMVTTSTFAASSTSFYVVAHEDDWQLFMGLNAALDVPAPDSKTVFVHTTAGDAGLGTGTGGTPVPYYLARESEALGAIRFLANLGVVGAGPNGVVSIVAINGKNLHRVAYKNTVAYFLRLPDGNINGGRGYPSTGNQSLLLLASGSIPQISAIDGSASYFGWADLVETLRGILVYEAQGSPDVWINVPDTDPLVNPNDHPDHIYTGRAMLDAIVPLRCVNAALFTGYVSATMPINLGASEVMLQTGLWAVTTSALTDSYQLSAWDSGHNSFVGRQYFRILGGTGACAF